MNTFREEIAEIETIENLDTQTHHTSKSMRNNLARNRTFKNITFFKCSFILSCVHLSSVSMRKFHFSTAINSRAKMGHILQEFPLIFKKITFSNAVLLYSCECLCVNWITCRNWFQSLYISKNISLYTCISKDCLEWMSEV